MSSMPNGVKEACNPYSSPGAWRLLPSVLAILSLAIFGLSYSTGCGDDDGGVDVDASVDGGDAGPDVDAGDAGPEMDADTDASKPDADIDAAQLCGNGVIDQGELCDDGNNQSGDGCNSTCTQIDDDDMVANAFTSGDQNQASAAGGGQHAIAVWTDHASLDADGTSVNYRMFGDDGTPQIVGQTNHHDKVANSTTAGDQHSPDVAVDENGAFVIVWVDMSNQGSQGADVKARLFNADGTPKVNTHTGTSDEFLVHGLVNGNQTSPSVASTSLGFIVVWTDDSGVDGSGHAVRARVFDPDGFPVVNSDTGDASAFTVNTNVTGAQIEPDVAADVNGQWVVAWTDSSGWSDTNGTGISAALLGYNGANGLGGDIAVNTTTADDQYQPAVLSQGNTGFAVFWTDESNAHDPSFSGIRGRLFDPQGVATFNGVSNDEQDFAINTTVNGRQEKPVAAVYGPGGSFFFVSWQDGSGSDGSFAGVRGRTFESYAYPAENPVSQSTDDFQINTTTVDSQLAPTIATPGPIGMIFWEDRSQSPPDELGSAIRFRVVGLE